MENLNIGQKVIFTKVFNGSYLKTGVEFEIEDVTANKFYFVSAKGGKTSVNKIDLENLTQFNIIN